MKGCLVKLYLMKKRQEKKHEGISTVLAFMLVPLSGFAMDIYVPSFPDMVKVLGTSISSVRLTLTVFLIFYGLGQLFLGSLIDSYGRYKLHIYALSLFILSNVLIINSSNIYFVIGMRTIQGLLISITTVSKRSFLVDIYEGEKLKNYTSLLSIVWSLALILAPFLGGFLQNYAGWKGSFYFLAIYASIMLFLECRYTGETLKEPKGYSISRTFSAYKIMLNAKDFSMGILFLGFNHAMAIVFGMSAPFIIEHNFKFSSVMTGKMFLLSGLFIVLGGLLSKILLAKPLLRKLSIANIGQAALAFFMFATVLWYYSLFTLMIFALLIHFVVGFMFNIYFTYCLTRFPEYAGTAGGLTSGGAYIVTSFASYSLVSVLDVSNQQGLAICYFILSLGVAMTLIVIRKQSKIAQK